jgi:hypothetical protein
MGIYAADFDAALFSVPDCERVVEEATALEHMAATVKALAAARLSDTEAWRGDGDRSPAHRLARKSGTSVKEAAQALETGKALGALPATAAAARRGQLSPAQAATIADASASDPQAEAELLEAAGKVSLKELQEEAARKKAAADDLESRREKIHRSRHLRTYTDPEGAAHLHLKDNPEVVAKVMGVVVPIRDRLAREAAAEGRVEPLEAFGADALAESVCSGGGRTSHKVLARIDLEALLRGVPVAGEVSEVVGYGPVAVSAIAEMLEAGGFLALVLTRGRQVLGVAHGGRRPRAHQESALQWLFPTCAVEGCGAPVRQWDHRHDWSKTHLTLLDWLDGYCCFHHDKKTHEGWGLVAGTGKRQMVGPDDPRHPKNRPKQDAPPAAA